MNKLQAKLTFCSGVGTVTGANFLLEFDCANGVATNNNGDVGGIGRNNVDNKKILIDCGMIQGEEFADRINRKPFLYDPVSIDALLVTHAHLDHVGRIPKLVREGFKGMVYSTPQTKELARLVLEDAALILAKEAANGGFEPIYTVDDLPAVFELWRTVNYHESFVLFGDNDGLSVVFKDAGHILGSAMIEIGIGGGTSRGATSNKILFTGDLGNSPAPLLRDTEPIGDVDYLVMESAYGDRNHEPKEERLAKFERIVNETIGRDGTLVIPSFSVDRTQILLYELNNLVETGRIRSVPVFLDSPMASKATAVYRANQDLFNDGVREQIKRGDDIFSFAKLKFTLFSWESKEIEKTNGPKIILAGSGMSMGGRVIGHEARYLPHEQNTILLVGYQTVGSLGRELSDGAKKVHINGQNIHVKAKIETLYGYSAHKDSDHLVDFVSTAGNRLKKVFVAMGEPKASMHLAQRLNGELGVKAEMPEIGRVYQLK